jgi:periplasmic protein TonB
MATCDQASDLMLRIAHPPAETHGLRRDTRASVMPAENKARHADTSSLQGIEAGDVFHSLIASGNLRPRSRWAAVGAVTFEVLILVTLVVVPLYRTLPLPKRERVTMLYLQPPAAGSGNPTKVQAPKLPSTYSAKSTVMTPPVHEAQEASPAPVGKLEGVVGGIPGGMVGVIPAGVFSEAENGAPKMPVISRSPEPTPVKRIRVASRVVEANLIHDVPPQYPPEAGRARVEGSVVLMAVIGQDGSVKDVRVESGLPILAQAAIDAVKQWRYKPYLIDGEPVEVDSRITINFTLSGA